MKQLVLVGALAGALVAGPAFAQGAGSRGVTGTKTAAPAFAQAGGGSKGAAKTSEAGGRTAPFDQPATAPPPTVPTGDVALGSVRIPKAVMADGKQLPAGTYQVRVTGQMASPDAKGQTASLERWLEFVQGGQVKGREVVTIVPQSDLKLVEKDTPPGANSSKFELLRGGDYSRLWINRGGNHYLVHFPVA